MPDDIRAIEGPIQHTPEAPDLWAAADSDLAQACREWIKGCTCAPADRPQDCSECTAAFLEAVLKRAQAYGLTIGSNALDHLP